MRRRGEKEEQPHDDDRAQSVFREPLVVGAKAGGHVGLDPVPRDEASERPAHDAGSGRAQE